MAITAFLSRSPGLLNRGPGVPASLGAGSLYRILSPTDWTSCAPSYKIVRHPLSCGRHKPHSFNSFTVKVISWYSSTECTCYLHRCISYFDSLAGVNMLQLYCSGIFIYGCFSLIWFDLVWFYGISTIVGHLMPSSFLYIWTVLFQTIQFSISTQFKCQKDFFFELFSLVN